METVLTPVCPDDEAMRRVAGGDSAALAVLFDRHKARLFAFLVHMLGERAAAATFIRGQKAVTADPVEA